MTPVPGIRRFTDSNVLLYLIGNDAQKAGKAEEVLRGRVVVSTQVLNEFASVARRKHRLDWVQVETALADIRHFAEVCPLDLPTHLRGLALAQRHQFSLYDAMIVAAALRASCDTLLSEDMQDGQVIERALTIRNPFA